MANTSSLSIGNTVYFLKDKKAISGKIIAFASKGSEHTPYTIEYSEGGIKKNILRSNTSVYMSSSDALRAASDKEQEKEGDTDIEKERAREAAAKKNNSTVQNSSTPVKPTVNSSTTTSSGALRRKNTEEAGREQSAKSSFKEEMTQKLNTKLYEALMKLKQEIASKIIQGE